MNLTAAISANLRIVDVLGGLEIFYAEPFAGESFVFFWDVGV
jgi:hypothetical protein